MNSRPDSPSHRPKGTDVFAYSMRVQLKGAYQTGVAEIPCMCAPEFNSHSEWLHARGEMRREDPETKNTDFTDTHGSMSFPQRRLRVDAIDRNRV